MNHCTCALFTCSNPATIQACNLKTWINKPKENFASNGESSTKLKRGKKSTSANNRGRKKDA